MNCKQIWKCTCCFWILFGGKKKKQNFPKIRAMLPRYRGLKRNSVTYILPEQLKFFKILFSCSYLFSRSGLNVTRSVNTGSRSMKHVPSQHPTRVPNYTTRVYLYIIVLEQCRLDCVYFRPSWGSACDGSWLLSYL